jgi:Prp8 binding protein
LLQLKSIDTCELPWLLNVFQVSAGSADRFVYIWDTTTRRILYKLPGHNGSINDVDFHPKEPIIMSGSSDKLVYIGEIE